MATAPQGVLDPFHCFTGQDNKVNNWHPKQQPDKKTPVSNQENNSQLSCKMFVKRILKNKISH